MPFFQSMAIRFAIKNVLESSGIETELAAHIGSVASVYTAAIFQNPDHYSGYQVLADSISKDFDLENQMVTDSDVLALVGEMENISASQLSELSEIEARSSEIEARLLKIKAQNYISNLAKKYNALHNSDSSKIEAVFSQIDLAQARITKDQEEIQSLAKETDDLLNQLEYKAS
jgi:tRNA isopentenyl-2-thiomethyl-A-37 hydroxylase MiaE